MFYTEYETPIIGKLFLVSDGDGLVECLFEHDRFLATEKVADYRHDRELTLFKKAGEWFDRYFAGERPLPEELLLVESGTEFQMLVREAMLQIPYGQTKTYGWIAQAIEEATGKPRSARAVGGAVGRNPLSIIVPCHRVMGAGGNLTGFGGGIATKAKLLEHEGVDMSAFHMPKNIPSWNAAIEEGYEEQTKA